MRTAIFARSEQLSPNPERFPLATSAGRQAANLWLQSAPLSAADFRDLRYRNLIAGTSVLPGDEERCEAFNAAFARQIALSIALRSQAGGRRG